MGVRLERKTVLTNVHVTHLQLRMFQSTLSAFYISLWLPAIICLLQDHYFHRLQNQLTVSSIYKLTWLQRAVQSNYETNSLCMLVLSISINIKWREANTSSVERDFNSFATNFNSFILTYLTLTQFLSEINSISLGIFVLSLVVRRLGLWACSGPPQSHVNYILSNIILHLVPSSKRTPVSSRTLKG